MQNFKDNSLDQSFQKGKVIQNLSYFKQTLEQQDKKPKSKKHNFNIIKHTRKVISNMTEKQRFKKAKYHFYDALYNRKPKLESFSELPQSWTKTFHLFRTTKVYQIFFYLMAFLYMYLIIPDIHQNFNWIAITQGILLIFFWIDILLQKHGQVNQNLRLISNMQSRFYFQILVLLGLLVDYIFFLCFYKPNQRVIRIFAVLRGFLPIFYDTVTRKNFFALISAIKEILVFLIFYGLVIVCFAIIGNQFIKIKKGAIYDQYTQNYGDLGKFIFILYVLSTYDAYPDNQLLAIQNQNYLYGFFIFFIFLNVFVFVNVPTMIIYKSFKDTRSKIILIDQIKQQHSLILAFVSLGQENLYLKNQKLIRFLLYLYRSKNEYINQITDICLKLDQNNTGSIQVSEFMQISKIIQQKQSMMPPSYYDWETWINFRKYINKKTNLKDFFQNEKTKLILTIIIILVSINNLINIYTESEIPQILSLIATFLYLLQILLKIIAVGLQDFFQNRWNALDFYLILISTLLSILFLLNISIPHNSQLIANILRIYRISQIFQLFNRKEDISKTPSILRRIKLLFEQITIIIPIIIKFFSLIIIFYYILGIIGMESFYTIYKVSSSQSQYSVYDQFSNFRTFIGSQIVFVQILVQAGWSMITFDLAFRSKGYQAAVMTYFVICHIIIVIILTSLFKGLVWEVYFAVDDQLKQQQTVQRKIFRQEKVMLNKKKQYQLINENISFNKGIFPTSIIKREIIQNKIDVEIFIKLKNILQKNMINLSNEMHGSKKNQAISKFILTPNLKQENLQQNIKKTSLKNQEQQQIQEQQRQFYDLYQKITASNANNFSQLQFIQQVDFEQKMENFLTKVVLNPKIQYSQNMIHPKQFVQFLNYRCKKVKQLTKTIEFDVNKNILQSNSSMNFHSSQLKSLLQINESNRFHRVKIAQNVISTGIFNQEQIKKQLQKKYKVDNYNIEVNYILRKIFLQNVNEDLVENFEIDYFSDIYGQKFKEINKLKLQPLLRYQSLLTYNLRNVLRFQNIQNNSFFQILSSIQSSCSSKLLKQGSLFKFVYQLDSLSDTWFTIQYSHQKEVITHFLKTGIWIYNKHQQNNQIYHGKDIFNWNLDTVKQRKKCQKFIKLFFQGFQTIALSSHSQKYFMKNNPEDFVYDLFFFFIDVSQSQLCENSKNLKISKIMLVILSEQHQREQNEQLPYELTDIEQQIQELEKEKQFKIEQEYNETFQKLKKMSVLDEQKITSTDGLPFAYIVNLMVQIQQILGFHSKSLVKQVETAINQSFSLILQDHLSQQKKKKLKRQSSKRISSQFNIT